MAFVFVSDARPMRRSETGAPPAVQLEISI